MSDRRVVVVTGAASGIGRATALLLGEQGARVVAADLDEAAGAELERTAQRDGHELSFRRTDVADREDVIGLIADVVERHGRLDGAFNNAGVTEPLAAIPDALPDDWNRVLAVNLSGVMWCLQAEIAQMLEHGGAIVNMASGAAIVPAPLQPAYTAAKHGVLGLTKLAASENARAAIRVNAVLPGTIDTPGLRRFMAENPGVEKMIRKGSATGELGTPEQVAEVVVWLLSPAASYVNGQGIVVDGGAITR